MASRSFIGIENQDGTITAVYCHNDSWRNEDVLPEHYNSEEKIRELISFGSISTLGETVQTTKFYDRDFGRSHPQYHAKTFKNIQEYESIDLQHLFLFQAGRWLKRSRRLR